MKQVASIAGLIAFLVIASCKAKHIPASSKDDGRLEVDFIQVNDVYEIAPLENGKTGGMARVAALKHEYLKHNPNTLLILAGDFVSPSVYNSLKYKDTAIRGRQMIEAMNAAGVNIVVFGNHEFDIKENELQRRINESDFLWISSNTFHQVGGRTIPFEMKIGDSSEPMPKTYIQTFKDADGTTARIGFIGLTIPFNKADYVRYDDPLSTGIKLYNQIKDSCDAVVAITHQLMPDDEKLAAALPGLALIIGGHEHDMHREKVGNVYITKAHANAKSAFVIRLNINKKDKTFAVTPELKYLDSTVIFDSLTNAIVQKWVALANDNYSSLGFEAKRILIKSGEPLDGRETEIRSHSTNLGQLVVHAMEHACPDAQLAIINAGSIRVDDILHPPVTEYDILRALPFGGAISEAEIKGSLLIKVLDIGRKNVALGGFLQISSYVQFDPGNNTWAIHNESIDTSKSYRVAIGEFLLSGKEVNLEFLNVNNPEVIRVYETSTSPPDLHADIRLAIVSYLLKQNGQ